ncbi:MAG TPA: hypothetical protein VMZ33_01920 [Candidatus Limnocylindrales bacterium]|nr:hypothetical protein [Candidatus Limnocylindrales bacterium]
MPPRREEFGNHPQRETRQIREERGILSQDQPVVARVCEQQQEVVDWVVAPLQVQPALECLGVVETHFQLDGCTQAESRDHRVSGTLLEGALRRLRKRNLGVEGERRAHDVKHSGQTLYRRGIS